MNHLSDLEKAISSRSFPKLPDPLQINHVSQVAHWPGIKKEGGLKPNYNGDFSENILYLFYGILLYTRLQSSLDVLGLPIAFVFGPEVLVNVQRYYPFDTGAVANGRVGAPWQTRLTGFQRKFVVHRDSTTDAPCKMVHCLFKTNELYILGEVNDQCKDWVEPFPILHEYLTDNLPAVDQRQRTIECHVLDYLPLGANLRWVGIPHNPPFSGYYLERIRQDIQAKSNPIIYDYLWKMPIEPEDIMHELNKEARKRFGIG